MILAHEQNVTESYLFSLKVQMVQVKMNSYLSLFTASFVCKIQKMKM